MTLRKIKIPGNSLVDLAREIKIRFPDSQLKIFKEKRKIIIKSKTRLNYFETKDIELIVKRYFPNHRAEF